MPVSSSPWVQDFLAAHGIGFYIMYLRKSRADLEAEARGEGETLARHRRALTELSERLGRPISYIFEEIVSGDTISSRPEMQKLLALVETGKCAGVFVNDVDRLARGDSIDQGVIKQAFHSTGTLIITPLKIFDPANVADEDFFDFNLFMARFEYKITKRRLQTGRMRSASEGNYLGSRPVYGYKRVRRQDRSGWTLEPVPEKADIVRMIFKLYAGGGIGADTIAKQLNDMGLRTDMGSLYSGGRVRKMLQNPAYIGQVSWAKRTKHIQIIDGVRSESRPKNDNPIIVDNAHPPIIDLDLWNTVQTMFREHTNLPQKKKTTVRNVLNGLIRCSCCGRTMVRRESNGRPDLLTCKTYNCPTTGIYIETVEKALLEALKDWDATYSAPSIPNTNLVKDDAPTRAAERQLATLLKQLDSLHDLLEQGIYSSADFLRRRGILNSQISALNEQIEATRSAPSREDIIRAELPRIRHVLESYPLTNDLKTKNDLLRSVIDHVDYNKTHKCMRNENPVDHLELTIYPRIRT